VTINWRLIGKVVATVVLAMILLFIILVLLSGTTNSHGVG
jgi:hypothetical protein